MLIFGQTADENIQLKNVQIYLINDETSDILFETNNFIHQQNVWVSNACNGKNEKRRDYITCQSKRAVGGAQDNGPTVG
jgi:hypothetical protein